VVFLIGMRINRLRSVRSWLPVFQAMPKMMGELARNPNLGLLHGWTAWSGRTVAVIRYWESMDKLMEYAAASEREHLPAWREFNRRARTAGGDVGIWHEAYEVAPQRSHLVYNGMPPFGMGRATAWKPAGDVPPQAIGNRPASAAPEPPAAESSGDEPRHREPEYQF